MSLHQSFCRKHYKKKFPADLVTFTEEILNGKLHILYSEKVFAGNTHKYQIKLLRIMAKMAIILTNLRLFTCE